MINSKLLLWISLIFSGKAKARPMAIGRVMPKPDTYFIMGGNEGEPPPPAPNDPDEGNEGGEDPL